MIGEWSEWVPVANWLNKGWNMEPEAPEAKGVYQFRVNLAHSERAGEVVYIGRAGAQGKKLEFGICARIAQFITGAMGFRTHSGGRTFYDTAADDKLNIVGHRLSVFDLEVSWSIDDDPQCREFEELEHFGNNKPVFNTRGPRPCNREDCPRRQKLLGKTET